MKNALLAAALLATSAFAHPSVSVVRDKQGNVYYSDLERVWRVAPDGVKTVAVPGVHSHELCVDAEGNLYGEHLWYEGEKVDKWGHYVWRLAPDGTLTKVIPAREGFLKDYSFVRDARGTMYWGDRGKVTVLRKKGADGRVLEVASAELRDLRWMTATADGTLFLIDDGDLVRVGKDGALKRLTADLGESGALQFFVGKRHRVMGLWPDPAGNVYVAVPGTRKVKRVAPDGSVSVVTTSRYPWTPTGGMLDPGGDLWILEWGPTNSARLRRIRREGKETIY